MAYFVLPIIDRQTGRVQFRAEGQWHISYVADPERLEQLISRSASRPIYDGVQSQLVIAIAACGRPGGRHITFSLAKFPCSGALAKLGS